MPGAMGVLGAWAVFIKAFAVRLAHKTDLGLVVSKCGHFMGDAAGIGRKQDRFVALKGRKSVLLLLLQHGVFSVWKWKCFKCKCSLSLSLDLSLYLFPCIFSFSFSSFFSFS